MTRYLEVKPIIILLHMSKIHWVADGYFSIFASLEKGKNIAYSN